MISSNQMLNLTKKRKPRGYWDINAPQEAAKYSSRNEFKMGSPSAYMAAKRMGVLDDICAHMPKHVDTSGKNNPNFKWTLEMLQAKANKYTTRGALKEGDPVAYGVAWKRGLLDQICSHMPLASNKAYTDEELHLEALKYTKRNVFCEKNNGAYQVACKRGKLFLDTICNHMEELVSSWSVEKVYPEALKYPDRTSFQKGSPGAWDYARRLGILDQICRHMKILGGSSKPERELFALIKNIYSDTKKFKDMRVNIPGKPYIHGFEIDILVGKLGIEFDGKHHHKYEYMRADLQKSLWSDDDIRNYHQLKDDWFATKGIQILHIREEDWITDKEKCITRCLEFLRDNLCP